MKFSILEPIGITACKYEQLKQEFAVLGHELIFFTDRNENEQELIKRAEGADAVVVSNIPITKAFLDACPNLSMISVAFTGVDHIDMEICRERNILVSNAAGFSTESVAELVIGMILSVYRKIVSGDSITRFGGDRAGFLGTELNGKTIGIVGAGAIGLRVAEIAKVFNCRLIAYNRSKKTVEGVEFVDMPTLLKESDVVSLHVPLTNATKGLIGKEEFKQMKPTAILINTARGPVVDSDALCEALENGEIAGAAVDVYEKEPPLDKEHILFTAPNLIMLPHLAFATNESFSKRVDIVMENIRLWLQGKPRNIMN
ncbi:hydroxyacid dehydrogenase [Labilibaculum sp. A4]|uniref:NAD(P)-dependent oxidoreductase n=1 Tax=Labilibaculum euxinus TaxID=2686357 RepID=UPI000F6168A7|nr:NAD(P)-dependent oxidoreductase [Labilibaculum euxinus]MDQ1771697.1 NAD(P)-dependent oxidoreductase [Labilibaculum euxinus]MWN77314.1 hydroxyacid dehydrogenase [Labilibaculum euxinus]